MPIYTYRCKECNLDSELLIKMDDRDEDQKCECGGVAVRTFGDVAAKMTGDWSAWNNPNGEAAMRKMQKKHKGSVPDHIQERHTHTTPYRKQKKDGN